MEKARPSKYPYDKLAVGDIVHCSGSSMGPFAIITRAVTAGWRRALDKTVATHTGIIVAIGTRYVVAEMQGKGITINSLDRYRDGVVRTRGILAITRYTGMTETNRRDVLNEIGRLIDLSLAYDYKGLIEFVNNRVKDDPGRMYCSELVYQLFRWVCGIKFPLAFARRVSPQDLYRLTTAGAPWEVVWQAGR